MVCWDTRWRAAARRWPRVVAAVILSIVDGVGGQDVEPSNGAEGCRCSTAREWRAPYTDTSTGEPLVTVIAEGGEYAYPFAYGLDTCEQWDVLLEPSCADSDGIPHLDAPTWCERRWCFVDADSCDQLDVQRSLYFSDVELYCASEDQPHRHRQSLPSDRSHAVA